MDKHYNEPLVSVGITTYNNPKGLYQVLKSITGQTYKNLEIIVSNDCSPEKETEKLVQEFAKEDPRVKYYYQQKNITGPPNYLFVLEKSTGKYFMWADDDDLWENNFVETGVRNLSESTFYQAWFCAFDNIDRLDRAIKIYEQFPKFTSLKNKKKEIFRYLKEPGLPGKPNITHSLFRADALKETAHEYFINDSYASDIAFNLAFLTKYNLIITDKILFHKRVVRKHIVDTPDKVIPLVSRRVNRAITPKRAIKYFHKCYKATCKTKYKRTVIFALTLQIPMIIFSGMLDKLDSIKKSLKKRFKGNG
jgi:glycosyltransferase involved in cell wall biosynthesis